MKPALALSNRQARALFIQRHGLAGRPADLLSGIEDLGFVQIDSINTVARAHHMILHARDTAFRPRQLDRLLERDRSLFEHWTHDASIIPTRFFPHWRLRFRRSEARLLDRWTVWRGEGFAGQLQPILERIRAEGPVSVSDVGAEEPRGSGGWWDWNPSKTALEFLWHTGRLSVCRREGFRKVYDLTERVIAAELLDIDHSEAATIDWAASSALDRLGFATSGEICAFWDKITPAEAEAWCRQSLARGAIVPITIANQDGGSRKCYARPDLPAALADLPEAPQAVRILSPFDPLLRDRQRAERLFGFHYRIEVFVPAPKRKYGYYVFPVMEADRIIGRIDMKAHRAEDRMQITAFWPEAGVAMGAGRRARLETAIGRTARLAGVSRLDFAPGWLRQTL